MIKNFLIPEGHQNPISGSKVTVILLKGLILPIGGALLGRLVYMPNYSRKKNLEPNSWLK